MHVCMYVCMHASILSMLCKVQNNVHLIFYDALLWFLSGPSPPSERMPLIVSILIWLWGRCMQVLCRIIIIYISYDDVVIDNYNLVSVFLPTSLVAILYGAFQYCYALQTITIPT